MITRIPPTDLLIPVRGGALHALSWGEGPDVLIAVHGITASGVSIQPMADRLADRFRIVAPDLRGRGGSAGLPGPFGMKTHADDLATILDHLRVERAIVLGESMGGYVAVQFAVSHPDRLERLVLVDGGLPLTVPDTLMADPDAAVAAILGPALQRLRMTFPSREVYRGFWQQHPALHDVWNRYLEAYVDADLTGEEPELRSRVSEEAVVADGRDQLVNDDLRRLSAITVPVTLIRAGRNLMNETPPLFPDAVVAECTEQLPQLVDVPALDFNHYSIMLTDAGADIVAEATIRRRA